ncbi:MAG: hypothetical protein ACJ8F7_21025 [Gemmataceae bacterium]
MITFRVTTNVTDDRRVVLTLLPEVPTGRVELLVTIDVPVQSRKRPRTSLAEWAEANAEEWGQQINSEYVEGFTGRRS